MKLKNENYSFELTMGAYFEIGELAGGSFEDIQKLLDDPGERNRYDTLKNMAIIMNNAYVDRIEYESPGRTAPRLSALPEKAWQFMSREEWNGLQSEVYDALISGKRAPEIEAEPAPEEPLKNVETAE